jgi:hypothetical protein
LVLGTVVVVLGDLRGAVVGVLVEGGEEPAPGVFVGVGPDGERVSTAMKSRASVRR